MLDTKQLCMDAAKLALPVDGTARLSPILMASVDGKTLLTLSTSAPPSLKATDIESALSSFPWILHARACTVDRWHTSRSTGSSPEVALVVDCYSAEGQWQLVSGVEADRRLSPVSYREVLAVHPLSAWNFLDAQGDDAAYETDWAQQVYQQRSALEDGSLEHLEARLAEAQKRLAQSQLHLSDLQNNKLLSLSFSPIVAFDFAKHSASINLEAIGTLASGRTSPKDVLSRLAENAIAKKKAHCEDLLDRLMSKLPGTKAAKLRGLLDRPARELLPLLGGSATLPEAQGLAYWALSFDHSAEGVPFAELAKAFKLPAKTFDECLTKTPLRFSYGCPVCAHDAHCDVSRFSRATRSIAFSLACDDCGHQEEYREGAWERGQLSCNCEACVKLQREASAVHLPRVALALEDAFRVAPGLASSSLHATAERIASACPDADLRESKVENLPISTEWDGKHAVYVDLNRDDDPAPVHHFERAIQLGPLHCGTQEEAIQAVSSLGPTSIHFLEHTLRKSNEPDEPFAYLPECVELLLEGDSLVPSDMLREWAKALRTSGLLHPDRSKFERLVLMPYGWLTCEFSSARQQDIESREDLVVWREVPKAEAVALSIRDVIRETGESSTYGDLVVKAAYASVASHGQHVLNQAQTIKMPEVQLVLRQLAGGEVVGVEALRAARDALKADHDEGALFYAALLWNYSNKGTGKAKMPLGSGKLAVFSQKTAAAARESYSWKTTVTCRRCSNEAAVLNFCGASENQQFWRVDCQECGHWDESKEFSYRYPEAYCDCQHCANAASVALKGKSTAALVSEIISHCVVEAHALSSKAAGVVVSKETELKDLLEKLKYDEKLAGLIKKQASKAIWKPLRFNTSAGLFRHLLPGYSFYMPPMEDAALLANNTSPALSRTAFRAFQKLLRVFDNAYGDEHLRFRLPLVLRLPDSIKEPKIPARNARRAKKPTV
jgi:hypothetical protein